MDRSDEAVGRPQVRKGDPVVDHARLPRRKAEALRVNAAELEQMADRLMRNCAVHQQQAMRYYARAAALRLQSDPPV